MNWLIDLIKEIKVSQNKNRLSCEEDAENKLHKNVNKEVDIKENDEYSNQDFMVNERNDF